MMGRPIDHTEDGGPFDWIGGTSPFTYTGEFI